MKIDGREMKAINGPLEGKYYHAPRETKTIIDHIRNEYAFFELIYYRAKSGWFFHSWKKIT
jgi:hypothetical protein